MGHFLRITLPCLRLHYRWTNACNEENQQRPCAIIISSGTFLLVLLTPSSTARNSLTPIRTLPLPNLILFRIVSKLLLFPLTNPIQWMLSRRQRAMYDPAYRQPHVYYSTYPPPHNGQQYGMYAMPPPVYDPNAPPPPMYQPPGGAKIDPGQARADGSSPAYEPGPPPAAHTNTGTGNNPFRS